MGGLTSKPTTVTRTVYQPTTTTQTESAEPEKSAAELASDSREKSLLRRDRGRSGTVQTSFRGLVNDDASAGSKTLLGQ